MIDINKTINNTLYDRFLMLKYQAINDPIVFKKILYAAIIKYMLYWAIDRDESQSVIKQLLKLLKQFLIKNCEFSIETTIDEHDISDYE